MTKLKAVIFILLMLFYRAAFAYSDFDHEVEFYSEIIVKHLPEGWSLADKKKNDIPEGHYWGLNYDGPKGTTLQLRGKGDDYTEWLDNKKVLHKDATGKEALEITIMPSSYSESWKKYFLLHRPVAAKLIFINSKIKVYGIVSVAKLASVEEEERVNEVFEKMKGNVLRSGPSQDSPSVTGEVSWKEWENDLQKALKSAGEK